MSSIIKSAKLPPSWLKNNSVLVASVRNHWNKDYKPAPYPKTEAERLAAAEKYGLLRSEYKPYPDDGQGAGDYPDLPLISAEVKDPFYPWDNPELKRNFNEPLHVDFDLIREDRYNVNYKFIKSVRRMVFEFFAVMLSTFGIYCLFDKVKMFPAVVPKQYPKSGKEHFTFEANPPPPKK